MAKVSVIHKGGNRNEVSNYRPVSVLPVFSKGFEKVIYVRLLAFLDAHSVITNSQFGFRKHCSTELALLMQKEIILRNFERNHLTLGVFIDFSKAFDSISHEILARKLYRYGIRGNALALLTSYLEDRFQRVAVNYSISSARKIKYGVPQGSILGPLLFNLYINDIVSLSSDATFIIYADDTSLFFSGTKGDTLVANANVVLRKICVWANSNSLKINATKTKAVLFRPRNRKIVLTSSIMLASETIEMSSVVKTLGVYFTEHMSWIHHIEQLRLKVSRVVGALCRCRHLLTSEIVRILYNALIQSHFTYCHLVWGVGSSFSSLLVVQKKVLRLIEGLPYRCTTAGLFEKHRIIHIQRLYKYRLSLTYRDAIKTKNELFLSLSDLSCSMQHYFFRLGRVWNIPRPRTNYGMQMLSFTVPSLLNETNRGSLDIVYSRKSDVISYFLNV